MEEIKISIIIPVYRVEEYLDQCLQSVIKQTYSNLEIILVDDGSTDSCPQICDYYAKQDNRIHVIHKANEGASIARNVGLSIATGEYVYFLDADDWIEEDALETLVVALEDERVDCLGFGFIKEFENGPQIENNTIWEEKTYKDNDYYDAVVCRSVGFAGDDLKYFQKMNAFAVIWSKLYKKSVLDEHEIRFKDIKQLGSFEDGLFNIQFFSYAKNFKYLDRRLYHYRKNNTQAVTRNYKKDFYKKQKAQMEGIESLVQNVSVNKLKEACNSRIAYMAMEYCLNALKNSDGHKARCRELKQIFKDPQYIGAIKAFSIKKLPFIWKVYYLILKSRCATAVYCATKMILSIRRK